MSTVDERIVSLKFENNNFEERTKQTLVSLEKLNKSIDFTNHTKGGKGLEEITRVVNATHFAGMEQHLHKISQRFSNLGVVGVTALTNITNSAVNAGKNLVKSLTIKPIKTGLDEYELKMGSLRTILASTRKDFNNEAEAIKTIGQYLNELNEYSDKTIYSFSDMTNNIGKFTNAGVKLDVAVQAIKGISNEAAISGATAAEASRAMYNFSQALSTGYVKLIDWKSIENANMATKEFKEQLLDTALALGTVKKVGKEYVTVTTNSKGATSSAFTATKNFNDALSYQWLTTDVLTTTLNNYAVDLKSMRKEERDTFRDKLITIGYTEKQIAKIEDTSKKAYEAASEITTWSKLIDTLQEAVQSGWAQTFELLFGNIKEATDLWTGIGKALSKIVDSTSDARNEMLKVWKDAGGRQAILNGIANSLKFISSLIKPIGEAFREFFPRASGETLAVMSLRFEEFTKTLKASDTTIANIKDTFRGLFSILSFARDIFNGILSAVLPATKSASSFAEVIISITGALGRTVAVVVDFINNLGILNTIIAGVRAVVQKLVSVLSIVAKTISSHNTTISRFITNVLSKMFSVLLKFEKFLSFEFSVSMNRATRLLDQALVPAFSSLKDRISLAYSSLVKYVKENEKISAIGSVYRRAFNEAGTHVDKLRGKLSKVTTGTEVKQNLIAAGSMIKKNLEKAFSSIKVDKIKAAFVGLGSAMKGLGLEIAHTLAPMFEKISSFIKSLHLIDKITSGVDFLAEKVKKFATAVRDGIHPVQQLKSWLDPRNFIDVANASGKAKSSYAAFGETVRRTNRQITSRPGGGGISEWLYEQTKNLSEQFENNPIVNTINTFRQKLFEALDELSKGWTNSDTAIDRMTGIVKIVMGLKLVNQSKTLVQSTAGVLDSWSEVFKNIGGLVSSATTITTNIGALVRTYDRQVKLQSIKVIALSITMLVGALYLLAKLDREELIQGGVALAAILTGLVVALKVLLGANVDDAKLKALALAIISVGGSLMLIATAAKIIAGIDAGRLIKAGVTIAAFFAMFALVAHVAASDAISIAGFVGLSIAVSLLVPAIITMSTLSFDTLMTGGAAIFAFVVLLSKAGSIASRNKAGFFAFVGIATAVTTMVPAIVVLAAMPLARSLKAALTLTVIMTALAGAVYIASSATSGGNVWMVTAMAAMVSALTASIIVLALVPASKLLKSVAALSTAMLMLAATSALMSSNSKGLLLMTGAISILIGALYMITSAPVDDSYPVLLSLSALLIAMSITVKILKDIPFTAAAAAVGKMAIFLAGITALLGVFGWVSKKIKGLDEAIKEADRILGLIGHAIGNFIGNIAGGFISGVTAGLEVVGTHLSNFMINLKPFLDGAREIDGTVVSGIKNLAQAALALTAAAFLDSLSSLGGLATLFNGGKSPMESLADGLISFASRMILLGAIPLPDGFEDKIKSIASCMKALGESAASIPATGGIRGLIMGTQDLAGFANQLLTFAGTLVVIDTVKFNKGWKGKLNAIADVLENLADAANKIPTNMKQDSVKSALLGVKSLTTFADQLKDAVPKIGSVITKVSELNAKKNITISDTGLAPVKAMGTLIGDLAEAADKVPKNLKQDSLSSLITGVKSIPELLKGFKAVSKALPDLISQTKGLDVGKTKKIKMMADIVSAMGDAAAKIDESYDRNGKALTGKGARNMIDKLSSFTNNMKEYVPGFKEFAKKASKIEAKDLEKATTVTKGISKVVNAAATLKKVKGGGNGEDLKNLLVNLAKGIEKYNEKIEGVNAEEVGEKGKALASSIKSVSAQLSKKGNFKNSASASISSYVSGLNNSKAISGAGSAAKSLRQSAETALGKTGKFKTAGKNCAEAFAGGLKSSSKPNSNAKSMGDSAAKKAKSANFYGAGADGARGFANGLRDPKAGQAVIDAGGALGKAAYKAAKKALDSKSPSKKMHKVGEDAAKGLANGIKSFTKKVFSTSKKVGDSGRKGLIKGFQNVGDSMPNPTITPVLDLSEVKKGADRIDSMIGSASNINAPFIDASIQRQNGGYIEEMVDKLGSVVQASVNQESGDTVNIGDVTVDVSKLEDVVTLNDFVNVLQMAKAIS